MIIIIVNLSCDCQVTEQIEGEARRYYDHAITLRNTLKFLRHNPSLLGNGTSGSGLGVDLLRLESMASLDPGTLQKSPPENYRYGSVHVRYNRECTMSGSSNCSQISQWLQLIPP